MRSRTLYCDNMTKSARYVVGTSGYSFADWVGQFYPPRTASREMFDYYASQFRAVELNYTYYHMPAARTLESLARRSGEGFVFYVKANQATTHKQDRTVAEQFIDSLSPLREAGKLAGVLMQFPQSFHRTAVNRKYLAEALGDFAAVPVSVEFRHCSWEHHSVLEGLRDRRATLVIPDAPDIASLYHHRPVLTSNTGYLRLHSRNAKLWYAGAAARYDYHYSRNELGDIAADWTEVTQSADKVYAFFNNCHRGQAAENAEAFRRIVGQIE